MRKTVKWGGAVVTLLLLVALIGSGWYALAHHLGGNRFISVSMGQVRYTDASGIALGVTITVTSGRAQEFHLDWGFHMQAAGPVTVYSCPLWLPLVGSFVVTRLAWRADAEACRRDRVGLCATCGYDRAGLGANSVCPECGAAASV